jgi:hypothetical protein
MLQLYQQRVTGGDLDSSSIAFFINPRGFLRVNEFHRVLVGHQ